MSRLGWLSAADGASPWAQAHVVVAGVGVSGFAAADGLLELGARVSVLDDAETTSVSEKGSLLEVLGATVRLGPGASVTLPEDADLVITTGWPPSAPLLVHAAGRGMPIWSEVELAWRLSRPAKVVPWLGITGTNGKTTTTEMLAAILSAAGLSTAAVGNIGRPVMETVLDPQPYDVLAVELSSHQLHWSHSLALHSAAVLNLQPDHLDWHGGLGPYAAAKATIYSRVRVSCVYNVADRATEAMVEQAEVVEGARAIGFTLGVPARAMVGVVDDLLVDRAFVAQRQDSALELAKVADVSPAAPHNMANALAAAALARSFGVPAAAVGNGLRGVRPGAHKLETVVVRDGVRWVDDSKATNPHAASAALQAFGGFPIASAHPSSPGHGGGTGSGEPSSDGGRIVWIAGGQAKGTEFDQLVARHRSQLRGAVVLGIDRDLVARALARHAPEVPVVVLDADKTRVMGQAVAAAGAMARPGDTVLLAPGCASRDMYRDYAARGEAFAAAVRAVGVGPTGLEGDQAAEHSYRPGEPPRPQEGK